MIAGLAFLLVFLVLTAVVVTGVRMATRNPELERQVRQLRRQRDQLGQLTAKLYEWGASGQNVPERAYVYEEISDVVGHEPVLARGHLKHLSGKEGNDELQQ